MTNPTEQQSVIALQVLQLGLTLLDQWAKANIELPPPVTNDAIDQAKSLLEWVRPLLDLVIK